MRYLFRACRCGQHDASSTVKFKLRMSQKVSLKFKVLLYTHHPPLLAAFVIAVIASIRSKAEKEEDSDAGGV